ncbi:MAG: PASTA domain-containing protein [Lachnospiraceae bacterium]|nr:PASTA domain-containing protein [Lachnospiraceae bacterium]
MLVKRKLLFCLVLVLFMCIVVTARLFYIQCFCAEELQLKAYEQQTRDRLISADRGRILDRNGSGIAVTRSVNTVSVIHSQIEDEQKTARFLSEVLEMDYDTVFEKVSKKVALERIKTKVDTETADIIRKADLKGVVVDEDIERVYPFSTLAAQVIGFVGRDNQGIIGLEAKYDHLLKGEQGKILTRTDVRGIELGDHQTRIAPVDGYDLVTSLDLTVQQYAEQTIKSAVEGKDAKSGTIIVMNPQNGEIYAMAIYPDFDLNEPFTINDEELALIWDELSAEERNNYLNRMWRNTAINDTYEPGSTFKILTSAAGLEEGVVTPESGFSCNGYHIAGDRMIKCWRYPRTHGSENFAEGVRNSCNPVFMTIAERLGSDKFYDYLIKFGLDKKTGIDIAGEATAIMYDRDDIGPVELATMSFGQSIQITPLQLLRLASAAVNGGYLVTPHFGIRTQDKDGNIEEVFDYGKGEKILSDETSETLKYILESVVAEGTGNKAYIPGMRIGGKTATSEKLPRRGGKYIASFMAFAPAEEPEVMALVIIDEPKGTYYGGSVAGPVMKELLSNILPYIGIESKLSETELVLDEVKTVTVPLLEGMTVAEAKNTLYKLGAGYDIKGDGKTVNYQFPPEGETINKSSKIILYTS